MVKYFAADRYTVEFCHYRIIPSWHALCYWFSAGYTSDLECWTAQLSQVNKAESIAKTIKSIEDVRAYHKPYEYEEIGFKKNNLWDLRDALKATELVIQLENKDDHNTSEN